MGCNVPLSADCKCCAVDSMPFAVPMTNRLYRLNLIFINSNEIGIVVVEERKKREQKLKLIP